MWLWEALVPHPPILVPEVGHGRENEARITLDGLHELTGRISDKIPDFLFILSPHHPYAHGKLQFNSLKTYSANLAAFGAESVSFNLPVSQEKTDSLAAFLNGKGIPASKGSPGDFLCDQGTSVPLYFFQKKLNPFPRLVIASPIGLSYEDSYKLGCLLREYRDGSSWALIASGDLSHRLVPSAPAGYSPSGAVFDKMVQDAISSGDAKPLLSADKGMIDDAGECGLRSLLVLMGLTGTKGEVLSYEGTFGVGYCNALWLNSTYPSFARAVVAASLGGISLQARSRPVSKAPQAACFVTIHNNDGSLRGCIGTLEPRHEDIFDEIESNAKAAAFDDPRFEPLRKNELANVYFSVDILSKPVPARKEELDPKVFGVIVVSGYRRGVLLPDLEGVNSVEAQLAIALGKAGISGGEDYGILKFTVERHSE